MCLLAPYLHRGRGRSLKWWDRWAQLTIYAYLHPRFVLMRRSLVSKGAYDFNSQYFMISLDRDISKIVWLESQLCRVITLASILFLKSSFVQGNDFWIILFLGPSIKYCIFCFSLMSIWRIKCFSSLAADFYYWLHTHWCTENLLLHQIWLGVDKQTHTAFWSVSLFLE